MDRNLLGMCWVHLGACLPRDPNIFWDIFFAPELGNILCALYSKKRQCPSVHQWFCNLWRLWACNAALLLLHYLHFWLKDFKVCKVKKLLNRCCIAIQDELMHSTRYPVLHLQSSIPNTKNIKKPLVRQCNQCNRGKTLWLHLTFGLQTGLAAQVAVSFARISPHTAQNSA